MCRQLFFVGVCFSIRINVLLERKWCNDALDYAMKSMARFAFKKNLPNVASRRGQRNGMDGCFGIQDDSIDTDASKSF